MGPDAAERLVTSCDIIKKKLLQKHSVFCFCWGGGDEVAAALKWTAGVTQKQAAGCDCSEKLISVSKPAPLKS